MKPRDLDVFEKYPGFETFSPRVEGYSVSPANACRACLTTMPGGPIAALESLFVQHENGQEGGRLTFKNF